jgi:Flp pilus assembly protein TadG
MLNRVLRTRSENRRKSIHSQRTTRRDSGAAMVEMAIAFGVLVTLLVGTVTAAIAFSQQNSIENAAREGSRYAATLPGDPRQKSWLEDVIRVTRAAGVGDLDATVPGQFICVAFVDGTVTALRESGGVTAATTTSSECYTDGLASTEVRVQVVTGRDSKIQAVFFSADLDLRGQAAARWER